MKILALDLSTHTGWALMEGDTDGSAVLLKHGTVDLGNKPSDYGTYPYCYVKAADVMVNKIMTEIVDPFLPDVIVTEETNPGKNRYSQKILEFIHYAFISWLQTCRFGDKPGALYPQVIYLDTGTWRRSVGLQMSKEQKKANAKLSKAKSSAKSKGVKLDKKSLGINGRITKKHLAVAMVNERFGLKLKQKDNNDADAILLGVAYCNNAKPCDGVR